MGDYQTLQKSKIGGKFTLLKQMLGQGSFGTIYLGQNDETLDLVAIKVESAKSSHASLQLESKILQILQGKTGSFNVMVFDILGPSLEDLFNLCERKFSLTTTIMIADQLISRIEILHSKGYIHRDIKPENFLIGLGRGANIIYLIDFGLGKKYRESRNNQHIPYRENKSLVGTARYATINSHLGMEQSRRDDIESIGYLLVYFLKGSLPWQGIKAADKQEKYSKIMDKKINTCPEVLCKGLPSKVSYDKNIQQYINYFVQYLVEFSIYLNYARNLKYEEKPDYLYLKKMFKELFVRRDFNWNYMYDWCLTPDNFHNGDEDEDGNQKYHKIYSKENNKGEVKLKIDIDTKPPNPDDQKIILDVMQGNKDNDISNQMIQSDYNRGNEDEVQNQKQNDGNDDNNKTPQCEDQLQGNGDHVDQQKQEQQQELNKDDLLEGGSMEANVDKGNHDNGEKSIFE